MDGVVQLSVVSGRARRAGKARTITATGETRDNEESKSRQKGAHEGVTA